MQDNRFSTMALALVASALLLVPAPVRAEKYALLAGVKTYNPGELRNLEFTENDVTDLADLLRASGYRPENIRLLTRAEGEKDRRFQPLGDNLRKELHQLLRALTPADSVLVALAGHGVQFKNSDESYFCPTDAKLGDPNTLVALSAVYRELEQCKAGFKLLLVDACRNDPFANATRDGSKQFESVTRPQKKQPPGGVAALFSCSAGEKAFEDKELKHGVFFHYVIDGLTGAAASEATGEVTLPLLEAYVQSRVPDHVIRKFAGQQTPERVGATRGAVALVKFTNLQAEMELRRGLALVGLMAGRKQGVLAAMAPRGDLEGAITALGKAIQINSRYAEAYSNRALLHWNRCHFEKALADCQEALKYDGKSPAPYCVRSLVYLSQSKLDPGIEDCNQALRLDPACTLAYCNRALLHWMKWQVKAALDDCNEALRLDPYLAVAYSHRGLTYWRLGKLKEAREDCDKATDLDPYFAGAYTNRALIYWTQKEYDRAIAECNKAASLDQRFPAAYSVRALNHVMKQEYLQAQADCLQALTLNPLDTGALLVRSAVACLTGRVFEGLADLDQAIRLNPHDAHAYENRGDVRAALMQRPQAAEDYVQALRFAPPGTPIRGQVEAKLRKLRGGR